jgi:hypothetical protein
MTNTARKLLLTVLGGGGFSPRSIPGLALWLDASDAGTLFQDDAGTTPAVANDAVVGRWADKSGNARHATQGTTADKPLLKLAQQNGKSALQFDSTSDYLDTADFGADYAQPTTYFIVCSLPTDQEHITDGVGAAKRQAFYSSSGFATLYAGAVLGTTPTALPFAVSVWTCVFNGAASSLRRNGALLGVVGDAGAQVVRQIRIGARQDKLAPWFYGGVLCEMVVVAGSVTDGLRGSMEAYLTTKWGPP